MKKTLYSALSHVTDPFGLFEKTQSVYKASDLQDQNSILILHGGADISPSIYNQKNNNHCFAPNKPSDRDLLEMALVNQAVKMGIGIIGICRGAQLLCAMDGGYLIQHIDGHTGGSHTIVDLETGEYYKANSCHHQMMVPKADNTSKIIAACTTPTQGVGENNKEVQIKFVPEIVYFPDFLALGIQGHPEWIPQSNFNNYCAHLINKYLLTPKE